MAASAAPRERVQVDHPRGAPDAEKERVEMVVAYTEDFQNSIGRDFRERCNKYFRQYRGVNKWRDAWVHSSPRDKDVMLYDAKKHWGAHLHIPLSYRTIETLVPAAIAHRPRMLYLPMSERWQQNADAVRLLVDAQQDQIDIDLPFQAIMRSGRIYGLGIGKSYWLKEYASRRRVKRRTFAGGLLNGAFSPKYRVGSLESECTFDDPMLEDVDPFDFLWDPYGSHLGRGSGRCGWAGQRIWMSLEACLHRINSGVWDTESVKAMVKRGRVEEELRGMGGRTKYDEVWQERMEASGFSSFVNANRGEQPHELIEWHDGNEVFHVLDGKLLVQGKENPCVGMYPFHTYRPTPVQKQMVGIGDLEPLEHLQREVDTMRSQQIDGTTLALAAGWIYDSAHVDEDDLVFGPAAAIEVRNAGDVRNVLQRIQAGDVPPSAIESQRIARQDFEAISGLTDALDPSGGGQVSTATQAQLVQASLSRRIELGSRRFEIEIVRSAARCFLRLDQRMILKEREMVVPEPGYDIARAQEEGKWRSYKLGPGELQGDYGIFPDGGSMAARNVPQDRQDANMFFNMARDNPYIDPRRPIMKGLELAGVRDPESWLKQSDPPVPPKVFEVLVAGGVDPELVQRAIDIVRRADPQLNPEQGPDVGQVDAMMGQEQAA